MPKITDEKKQQRRDEIISSSFRCFAKKGFLETTMRDIFEESGLSSGAVYSYFENKEAIVNALCAQRTEDYINHLEQKIRDVDTDIGELLAKIIESYVGGFGNSNFDEKSRVNAQMWSMVVIKEEVRKNMLSLFDRYVKALTIPIKRAQERNEIDQSLDSKMIAEVMITMIFGLDLRKTSQETFDIHGFAKVTRSLFSGNFILKAT